MEFTVVEISDGDTFTIDPGWIWGDKQGDRVRPVGFDTPEKGEKGYEAAKNKLKKLLLGKTVKLSNPIKLTYGRLLCTVLLDGKDLKDYFPEYQ